MHRGGGEEAPKGTSNEGVDTYRMTNLRGRTDRTGNRAKQMTKQARAPKLHAPKTNKRSHLLTVDVEENLLVSLC